eukprot:TRINITY_DN11449_c0_g1_i7.p3 TRINITY_DN11449_c0_g1~~TRINITY_DN11449_c0_g1_i7.p3  ORF type:complete len:108 (+),score=12.95 TRINITY_DN11449_c0_g1_i7:94-417(+)
MLSLVAGIAAAILGYTSLVFYAAYNTTLQQAVIFLNWGKCLSVWLQIAVLTKPGYQSTFRPCRSKLVATTTRRSRFKTFKSTMRMESPTMDGKLRFAFEPASAEQLK